MKSKQPIYKLIRNLDTGMVHPVSELAISIMIANKQKFEILEGDYYITDGDLRQVQKIKTTLKEDVINYMQPIIAVQEEKKNAEVVDNTNFLDNKKITKKQDK